jgi:cell division inhibitor SepF
MSTNCWFKKREPAQEFDEFNSDYYGEDSFSARENAPENDDAYAVSDASDVSVVLSAPAKDEPLMKKTFVPADCNDSPAIVDAFKQGRVAVICIENLDKPNFYRLFDYLMGAVQALDGELEKLDRDTVVLFPYGVDTETDIETLDEDETEDEQENDSEDLD